MNDSVPTCWSIVAEVTANSANALDLFCRLYNRTFLLTGTDRLVWSNDFAPSSLGSRASISDDVGRVNFQTSHPSLSEISTAMAGFHNDLEFRPSILVAIADFYLRSIPEVEFLPLVLQCATEEELAAQLIAIVGEDSCSLLPFSILAPGLVQAAIVQRVKDSALY